MSNRPTTTDIATVVKDVKAGAVFDPSEHSHYWNCELYRGDRWCGEGQGSHCRRGHELQLDLLPRPGRLGEPRIPCQCPACG
jgi:hypothetical protein